MRQQTGGAKNHLGQLPISGRPSAEESDNRCLTVRKAAATRLAGNRFLRQETNMQIKKCIFIILKMVMITPTFLVLL